MARKPSQRRNYQEPGMDLNLTPMMNMIAILIPALLVSVAFIEISTLEARAPAIDGADVAAAPDVNLVVAITDRGFRITGVEAADSDDLPLVQRRVSCDDFIGTRPPPRTRNLEARPCTVDDGQRSFWVYDLAGLQARLGAIKTTHPQLRRLTIAADPDVNYEAITDVMDVSREQADEGGGSRVLFDEVLLSPGITL